jgi:hypothetical protein
LEKSSLAKPGVLSRPLNRVLTPVMRGERVLGDLLDEARHVARIGDQQVGAPIFMKVRQFAVSAKMWYSGSAVMMTFLAVLHVGA